MRRIVCLGPVPPSLIPPVPTVPIPPSPVPTPPSPALTPTRPTPSPPIVFARPSPDAEEGVGGESADEGESSASVTSLSTPPLLLALLTVFPEDLRRPDEESVRDAGYCFFWSFLPDPEPVELVELEVVRGGGVLVLVLVGMETEGSPGGWAGEVEGMR